jgi:hypothetical protein
MRKRAEPTATDFRVAEWVRQHANKQFALFLVRQYECGIAGRRASSCPLVGVRHGGRERIPVEQAVPLRPGHESVQPDSETMLGRCQRD